MSVMHPMRHGEVPAVDSPYRARGVLCAIKVAPVESAGESLSSARWQTVCVDIGLAFLVFSGLVASL